VRAWPGCGTTPGRTGCSPRPGGVPASSGCCWPGWSSPICWRRGRRSPSRSMTPEFRRRGRKVHGAGWFHDGSAAGTVTLGFGNNWVVAAIIVTLPFGSRPVALPVLAALAVKGGDRSTPNLARDLVDAVDERFPDRGIQVVAAPSYGCGAVAKLGHDRTMTTRARSTAVFHELAPPRTGKRGRPRLTGDRIGTPTQLATSTPWRTVLVTRYGTTAAAGDRRTGLPVVGAPGAPTPSALSSCAIPGAPPPRPVATTSRWSPPTSPRHPSRSSPATPPGGPSTPCSSTSKTSSASAKPATGCPKPSNAPSRSGCSATPCSSSDTPCTATPPPTPHTAGRPRPGTGPRPNPPPSTCSPHSAASSSPPDFSQKPPDQPQPKKSSRSSTPGH